MPRGNGDPAQAITQVGTLGAWPDFLPRSQSATTSRGLLFWKQFSQVPVPPAVRSHPCSHPSPLACITTPACTQHPSELSKLRSDHFALWPKATHGCPRPGLGNGVQRPMVPQIQPLPLSVRSSRNSLLYTHPIFHGPASRSCCSCLAYPSWRSIHLSYCRRCSPMPALHSYLSPFFLFPHLFTLWLF